MIIALMGASGSGKSTIEKKLVENYGFNKVISYTTREKRDNEVNGEDYCFISKKKFSQMLKSGCFAEYEEYSQGRFYGTLKPEYSLLEYDEKKVVVLTPNGIRQVKENCQFSDIFVVLVEANLGTRMKRYIKRCGVSNFNFDDKNEISARVERDYGMFLGMDKQADLVVHNDEGTNLDVLVHEIVKAAKEKKGW